jgi:hypothetical protein
MGCCLQCCFDWKLLAGRPNREFDPIAFSENTLQVFARRAKAFADLAENDLNDYQAS